MNYLKIYENLIQKAKSRIIEGYKEKHHILPKCLGGKNDKDNLVDLTPEEHFIAHLLLTKIYPDNSALVHAAVMMTVNGKNHVRNNKLYGWLRRKHSDSIRKNQSREGNSQFGKYWIYNIITGEVLRTTSKDIPEGWIRGKTGYSKCEICNKSTGSKQRRFCINHKPKSIPPKSTMSKGSPTALKLSAYCKSRTQEQHPQYGKIWVNNGYEQRMIPKDQVTTFLDIGWIRGKLRQLN